VFVVGQSGVHDCIPLYAIYTFDLNEFFGKSRNFTHVNFLHDFDGGGPFQFKTSAPDNVAVVVVVLYHAGFLFKTVDGVRRKHGKHSTWT